MDTTKTKIDQPYAIPPSPSPEEKVSQIHQTPTSHEPALTVLGPEEGMPRIGGPLTTETPDLEKPSINMADLAALIFSITEQLSKSNIKTGQANIESQKQQNRDLHKERMKKIKEQIENMLKAEAKSGGFFGKLLGGLKKAFRGDFKGFAKDMDEGFHCSPFTGSAFTTILFFTSTAVGPVNALMLTSFAFTPEIVMDPAVQKEIQNFAVEDLGMSQESAQKFAMYMGIGVTVIHTFLVMALTGGAGSGLTAARQLSLVYSLVSAGITVEGGVHSYQANKFNAEALQDGAEADTIQADQEFLSTMTEKQMVTIKAILDILTKQMEITAKIIQAQMETSLMAAKAIGHHKI
jgi:hypothetical protein